MIPPVFRVWPVRLVVAALVAMLLFVAAAAERGGATRTFASLVADLSEQDGYFDTDNLISNERSYLHVIPALRQAGLTGGAYIGVGPDQNFSYIAQLRPQLAFIVDVRRDNLLLHLLLKALFDLAGTRVEYLSLLFNRPVPDHPERWRSATIEKIIGHVDGLAENAAGAAALRDRLDASIRKTGIPVSPEDLATITRFHRTFIKSGLSLKFESHGRRAQSYYPTYRELLLETDRQGNQASYLATEDAYQVVRRLQEQDRIVPVVGNLSGTRALPAVARYLVEQRLRVSAIYTSNVEFYLFRDDSFPRFVENVARMPFAERGVIIRSVFTQAMGQAPPELAPGYYSASLIRPIRELVDGIATGRYRSSRDLARPR
jgi:hypothetical protein